MKINWTKITYSGKHHAILFIDTVFNGYTKGYIGKFFRTNFSPKYYRQFDGARWWSSEEVRKYMALLKAKDKELPGFLFQEANEYKKLNVDFFNWSLNYKKSNFINKSNRELKKIFLEFFNKLSKINAIVYTPIFMDRFYTDEITAIIAGKEGNFKKRQEYLDIIFSIDYGLESHFERASLIELAKRYQKADSNFIKIRKEIEKHILRFEHLYMVAFYKKQLTIKQILKDIRRAIAKGVDLERERLHSLKRNSEKVKKIFKNLKLSRVEILKVNTLRKWIFIANNDDHYVMGAIYNLWPFWYELAHRLKISFNELIEMRGCEIEKCLSEGAISPKLKVELADRVKENAMVMDSNGIKILITDELKEYYRQEKTQDAKMEYKTVRGVSANAGKARGYVRLLLDIRDISKVKKGDILVAIYTYPAIVVAMKKASAIVTDQGGLLSHAAIVSREFNKPCIIGTKIATKVLKDRDLVEVDANKGIVRILKNK